MTIDHATGEPRRIGGGHYLSTNDATWTPRHVAFLAAAGETAMRDGTAITTLTAWHVIVTDRKPPGSRTPVTTGLCGTTGAELGRELAAWTDDREARWLWVRDLARTIHLTGLAAHLTGAGWTIASQGMGCNSPWLRFKRGSARLTVVDWPAWVPSVLDVAARELGLPPPGKPAGQGGRTSDPRWCGRVSELMAAAVLDVLAWWDNTRAGYWTLTAAGCSWNQARHVMPERSIWISTGPGQREYARAASYGGRRWCSVWGKQPPGRWTNEDFSQAHANLVAYLPMPEGQLFPFTAEHAPHQSLYTEHRAVIAAALLDTRSARYPARIGGRIVYARGRFWTLLAGPELAEAKRRGELARLGPGYAFRMGRVMSGPAKRSLDIARNDHGRYTRSVQLFHKHAGRTLPGKFAGRTYETTDYGPMPSEPVGLGPVYNLNHEITGTMFELNGRLMFSRPAGEGHDALPAFLAMTESAARVRIGRAADTIGPDQVACGDTDGLYARDVTDAQRQAVNRATGPLTMRAKHHFTNLDIRGPQALQMDGRRILAGIPRDAEIGPDWRATYSVLDPASYGIPVRDTDGYTEKRTTTGAFPYSIMAWLASNGRTVPLDLYTGTCGGIHSRPFESSPEHAAGWELAADQSPHLVALAAELAPVAPECVAELGCDDSPWDAGRSCPARWGWQRPWTDDGAPCAPAESDPRQAAAQSRVEPSADRRRARRTVWRWAAWIAVGWVIGYRRKPFGKSPGRGAIPA